MRQHVSMNTGQTIKLDLDVLDVHQYPTCTGTLSIFPKPTSIDVEAGQSQLCVVYDPVGHVLSTIINSELSLLYALWCLHVMVLQQAP